MSSAWFDLNIDPKIPPTARRFYLYQDNRGSSPKRLYTVVAYMPTIVHRVRWNKVWQKEPDWVLYAPSNLELSHLVLNDVLDQIYEAGLIPSE